MILSLKHVIKMLYLYADSLEFTIIDHLRKSSFSYGIFSLVIANPLSVNLEQK